MWDSCKVSVPLHCQFFEGREEALTNSALPMDLVQGLAHKKCLILVGWMNDWIHVWMYKEMDEWKRDGWMQMVCWKIAIKKTKHKKALTCTVLPFPQCKYSRHGWFQATKMTSLGTELGKHAPHWCIQVCTSSSCAPLDGRMEGGIEGGREIKEEERGKGGGKEKHE